MFGCEVKISKRENYQNQRLSTAQGNKIKVIFRDIDFESIVF